MSIVDLSLDNFEKEINEPGRLVLMDFWGNNCRPCKAMLPLLKQVGLTYADHLKVVKVNVDEQPVLAEKYEVKGVPTLILLEDGKIQGQKTGYITPSQIRDWLEQHLPERKNKDERSG